MSESKTEVSVTINADNVEFKVADFSEGGKNAIHSVDLREVMARAAAGDVASENTLLLWVVQGHLGQLNSFFQQQAQAAALRQAEALDPKSLAERAKELAAAMKG